MKRFEFKQERLLRIRQQLRRQSEMQLLQLQSRLAAAKAEQREIDRQLENCVLQAVERPNPSGAESWNWLGRSQSLQRMRALAEQSIQQLQNECTVKAAEVRERATEFETLEALKLRQWRSYRESVAAEKQQQLDEVAVGMWRRQQAESEVREASDD
jgi:hypothetical protein